MSVDIRSCDMYDLKYTFLKGQTVLLENNTKSISYNMDYFSFFGHESKIVVKIKLINVVIAAVYPRALYKFYIHHYTNTCT